MLTNKEIVDTNIDLILRCVDCQFAAASDYDKQNKGDFLGDLILILYNYDQEKLNNAYREKHLNALITRIIQNNLWSKTSQYYKDYKKLPQRSDPLDNIEDDD